MTEALIRSPISCSVSAPKPGGLAILPLVIEIDEREEMKEYEVCDFRYDEGFRPRLEKDIMPTLTTHQHDGGGYQETLWPLKKKSG